MGRWLIPYRPPEQKTICPGLALGSLMKSVKFFQGLSGWTMSRVGLRVKEQTGVKSRRVNGGLRPLAISHSMALVRFTDPTVRVYPSGGGCAPAQPPDHAGGPRFIDHHHRLSKDFFRHGGEGPALQIQSSPRGHGINQGDGTDWVCGTPS